MTLQKFQTWHRTLGIIAAVFAVILSGTGLLLNHTDDLDLSHVYLDNEWLLDWYGIGPAEEPETYRAAGHWITRIDSHLYYDDRDLGVTVESLNGAVAVSGMIVVAMGDGVLLLTEQGRVIERLTALDGVPADIRRIGLSGQHEVLLETPSGRYSSHDDLLEWDLEDTDSAEWSVPADLASELGDKLLRAYRGQGVSVETVILEIHSGRILGRFGVLLADLTAILFLFLAVSGLWVLWLKRRLNIALSDESDPM